MPATVTVTPSSANLSALGETVQLTATVRDQNGNAMLGVVVSWSSSAPTVATMDATGLVTAAGNGSATVAATAGVPAGSRRSPCRFPTRRVRTGRRWWRCTRRRAAAVGNRDNWGNDCPPGEWHGVGVDTAGRVVSLRLVGRFSGHSPRIGMARDLVASPIPTDPIRERSVAPRRVVAGKAPWRLGAIIRPLIGRRSGGSDGKTPACHSPPPRVPRLTVWGDMERDARFLGQPVPREVVAEDPEQVTAVATAVSVPPHAVAKKRTGVLNAPRAARPRGPGLVQRQHAPQLRRRLEAVRAVGRA